MGQGVYGAGRERQALGLAFDELDPRRKARVFDPRRAPPASISGLWSIPTTRHGYRRASAIATAAVPVATSATRASGRDAAGAICLDHEVVPAAILAERQELCPTVVVAGDAGEEPAGVHLSVGDGGHPQYHRTRARDAARPCRARPRRRRPSAAAASRRRRGGSARAGGLRDDARLRRACRFASTCTCGGSASRRACSSSRRRISRRSRGSSPRRWARSTAPDAVLRVVWTPGAGGDGSIGFVLVTPLPGGFDEMRARGIELASLQLAIGAATRSEAPWLLPGVKSTSYAVNMAAQAEARRRGADDALFLSLEGIALECPTSNIWFVEDGVLHTPGTRARHPGRRHARDAGGRRLGGRHPPRRGRVPARAAGGRR